MKSRVSREKDPKQWKEQVLEHPAPSQTRMQGPREGRPAGSLEAVARSRSEVLCPSPQGAVHTRCWPREDSKQKPTKLRV